MAKTKHTAMKCPKGSVNSKSICKKFITDVKGEKDKKNKGYDTSDSDESEGNELDIGYSIFSGKNFTMDPTFTILYHKDNIKKQVSLKFFDCIKSFKILRHWILLSYTGDSGFIATVEEKKELLGKWLNIHKKSFAPTTVDNIYRSSSAAREGFTSKLARKTTTIHELDIKDSNSELDLTAESKNFSTSSKLKRIKKEGLKKEVYSY